MINQILSRTFSFIGIEWQLPSPNSWPQVPEDPLCAMLERWIMESRVTLDHGIMESVSGSATLIQNVALALFTGMSRRGSVWHYQLDHIPCERGAWFGALGYAMFIYERGLPLNTKASFGLRIV